MISLIHRWVFGVKQVIKINLSEHGVAECTRCHMFLQNGFATSLMSHLETDHKMHYNTAIETAERMLDLVYQERMKRAR